MAAVGGLALSVPFLASRLRSDFSYDSEEPFFSTSFNAIGTTVTVIIDDPISKDYGNQLVSYLSNQINSLGQVLTRFRGGTDLFTLNRKLEVVDPSPSLVSVMKNAASYSQATQGSFDVTVKPVLDLLQAYLQGQPFPSDSQFEKAKSLIDYEAVSVSNSAISLNKEGMGVTLDGIATGYILEKSVALFKSKGIKSALINFGGTLAVIGSRSDGSPWKIGIVDPISPTNTIGDVYLRDQAVATSGDYENYFTSNKEYYHVINPTSARSPLFSHSATVVASTSKIADPLGVALMIKPPDEAIKLLDSYPAECLLYTDDQGVMFSSGMKQLMKG